MRRFLFGFEADLDIRMLDPERLGEVYAPRLPIGDGPYLTPADLTADERKRWCARALEIQRAGGPAADGLQPESLPQHDGTRRWPVPPGTDGSSGQHHD